MGRQITTGESCADTFERFLDAVEARLSMIEDLAKISQTPSAEAAKTQAGRRDRPIPAGLRRSPQDPASAVRGCPGNRRRVRFRTSIRRCGRATWRCAVRKGLEVQWRKAAGQKRPETGRIHAGIFLRIVSASESRIGFKIAAGSTGHAALSFESALTSFFRAD